MFNKLIVPLASGIAGASITLFAFVGLQSIPTSAPTATPAEFATTYSMIRSEGRDEYVLDTGLSLGDCFDQLAGTRNNFCEVENVNPKVNQLAPANCHDHTAACQIAQWYESRIRLPS